MLMLSRPARKRIAGRAIIALPAIRHIVNSNVALLLADLNIADGDGATVVVDAPAVLLDAVDALRVADDVVDVHDEHRVVGVDVDVIDIVCRAVEAVAVSTLYEALAFLALLFEVQLAVVLVLRVYHHGVVFL